MKGEGGAGGARDEGGGGVRGPRGAGARGGGGGAWVGRVLGGATSPSPTMGLPTLVLGDVLDGQLPAFCIQPSWDHWQASITPAGSHGGLVCVDDNPLSGVAAAALAVNEAFLFVRGDLPEAG